MEIARWLIHLGESREYEKIDLVPLNFALRNLYGQVKLEASFQVLPKDN